MDRNSESHLDAKPVSERRSAANRMNASKSTGPKTEAGKERSRRNALKHGLAAQMLDAPGLDPEIERDRIDAWMKSLNPHHDEIQAYFVEQAVRTSFRLERCDHAQKALIAAAKRDLEATCDDEPEDEAPDRNGPADQFRLLLRYEMQSERSLVKLVKDLRERAEIALADGILPRPVAPESKPAPSPAPNEPKPAFPRHVEPVPEPLIPQGADGDWAFVDIAITPRTNPITVEKQVEYVHTEAEIRLMKRFAPQFLPKNEGCIDR